MGNTANIISEDELASILESNTSNTNFIIRARNLKEAINDWPTPVSAPEEFLLILHHEIGKPLTKENIERYANSLDARNSAWKVESIASVLAMFDNYTAKTFDEIIANISNQFRIDNAK